MSDASLIARRAAHVKWSKTPDRAAATAPARGAFLDRFVEQVRAAHPEIPEKTVLAMAESLKKAYFCAMARKSVAARRARAASKTA